MKFLLRDRILLPFIYLQASCAGCWKEYYDGNGNLITDQNKSISSINYNYLNLPQQINITSKGNIQYVYDATGTKWQKIVTDQTKTPNIITTTTYIDGFIYNNDTLQYLATEEGRVRPKLITDSLGYVSSNIQYIYDYYLKDHLGDIRLTLTEETQTDLYAATMESQNATLENLLFNNVSTTQFAKPTGFDTDTSNHYVSMLNGSSGTSTPSNPRIGPSIVLQVMAGDTLAFGVNGWYSATVQSPPSNDNVAGMIADLLGTLSSDVVTAGADKLTIGEFPDNSANPMQPGMLNLLDIDSGNYVPTQPKAYLNWAAFDGQFNMVNQGGNSGALQMPEITSGQPAQPLTDSFVVQKNGYIYIYVSNESSMDVFFDNLVIHHHHGPLLEEDHYYPFGLNMAAISDLAILKPENKFKYNGKELQHKEFSDGTGLEDYDYTKRFYDPQIGRFISIDRMADKFVYLTPYQFASNDPILNVDLDGLEGMNSNLLMPAATGMTTFTEVNREHNIANGDSPQRATVKATAETAGIIVGVAVGTYVAAEVGIGTTARAVYSAYKTIEKDEPADATAAKSDPQVANAKNTTNKLSPDKDAGGDHTTFVRDNNGNVYQYQDWTENDQNPNGFDAGKRFDGGKPNGEPGAPHYNKATGEDVQTPHVHDPNTPGKVRVPEPSEIPNNPRFQPKKPNSN